MTDNMLYVHNAIGQRNAPQAEGASRDQKAAGLTYPAKRYNVDYMGGTACGAKPEWRALDVYGTCMRPVGHDGPHISYSGDIPVAVWTTAPAERAGYVPIYHYIHPKHRAGIPEGTFIEFEGDPPWSRSPVSDPACGDTDPSGHFTCTRKPDHRGAHEAYVNVVRLASWSWRKVEAA